MFDSVSEEPDWEARVYSGVAHVKESRGQQLGDLSSNPAFGTCERGSLLLP